MTFLNNFRSNYTVDHRKRLALKMRNQYPDRIPAIVASIDANQKPFLEKCKYLIPCELTVSQFLSNLRNSDGIKENQISKNDALYMLLEESNMVPPAQESFGEIDKKYKNKEDEFLYLVLAKENTFGSR